MASEPPKAETSCVASELSAIPSVHRFTHSAMAATFEIIVQHEDKVYARQAANAAFDELDRIERNLSRFVENSDVARMNNLPAGQPLLLGLETFECLRLCQKLHAQADGAFDVTIGFLLDCWRDKDKKLRTPSPDELAYARAHTGMSLLHLDESRYTVELSASPVRVDLGGVGKGYGVDKMAAMLEEWSIDRALLHGGYSSVLALDPPEGTAGWPVTLSDPQDRRRVLVRLQLAHRAVSGSGLQKGPHIIDPRLGRPVEAKIAAWSMAPDAATADALSTAFMIMTPQEVKDYCGQHPQTRAWLVLPDRDGPGRFLEVGEGQ
ncbi:MAG: FAD:protein FMN transferase [Sedimentisphaerales bacterium]|nr:FAD:protein FMN transferase [Sedimentisphaerales bacterium]